MLETTLALDAAFSRLNLAHPTDRRRSNTLPLLEDLYAQQLQLRALLAVTLDEQGGVLRLQSQELRDGFLLACSMMGDEVRQLADVLQNRLSANHAT